MTAPRLAPSPHEIVAEFAQRTRSPTQAQLDALMHRSMIPLWALAGAPGSGEFGIGFARLNRLDDGRFDFAEGDGEPAMTIVARDWFGDPADIVATRPDGFLAAWIGRVSALGLHNVFEPRLDPALTVHRTPFDWLRDHRHGVVLIDGQRAATELRDFGPFLVADVEQGLQLESLMTPRMPSIPVRPDALERRAA